MRKLILVLIPVILLFTSCKKENASSTIDEITYELSISKGGFKSITYADEWENPKDIDYVKSNTSKVTFKNNADKKERMIFVYFQPNLEGQHTVAKIYINGKMVEHDEGDDVSMGFLGYAP